MAEERLGGRRSECSAAWRQARRSGWRTRTLASTSPKPITESRGRQTPPAARASWTWPAGSRPRGRGLSARATIRRGSAPGPRGIVGQRPPSPGGSRGAPSGRPAPATAAVPPMCLSDPGMPTATRSGSGSLGPPSVGCRRRLPPPAAWSESSSSGARRPASSRPITGVEVPARRGRGRIARMTTVVKMENPTAAVTDGQGLGRALAGRTRAGRDVDLAVESPVRQNINRHVWKLLASWASP